MSEMAKDARRATRAKAARLTRNDPHKKVDASSWTPNEALNADRKTGARPVRPRIYKHGGKIQGDRGPRRADKTPRGGFASGGKTGGSGALSMRDTAGANKEKFGSYHDGGYKKGGRTKRDAGGMTPDRAGVPASRMNFVATNKSPFLKRGGKAEKATPVGAVHKHEKHMHKGEKETKFARGGKVKNGKTNINIIIGKQGPDQPMPPQGVVRPPMPPPGPPPGGPPPGGPPPGGPPPGAMPPGGMPPGPMPRRRGGKVYRDAQDMDAGAMSGEGRLEKTEIQARKG